MLQGGLQQYIQHIYFFPQIIIKNILLEIFLKMKKKKTHESPAQKVKFKGQGKAECEITKGNTIWCKTTWQGRWMVLFTNPLSLSQVGL